MSYLIREYNIPISSVGTPYAVTLDGTMLEYVRLSQNNQNVVIFCTVGTEQHPTYSRNFMLVTSEMTCPDNARFIGTSTAGQANTFYHVFEIYQ